MDTEGSSGRMGSCPIISTKGGLHQLKNGLLFCRHIVVMGDVVPNHTACQRMISTAAANFYSTIPSPCGWYAVACDLVTPNAVRTLCKIVLSKFLP